MGKMMILTFNDNEEDMFRHIMSYVSVEARAYTTTDLPKGVLNLGALHIDKIRRIVSKNSVEIELTFTEFEIWAPLGGGRYNPFENEMLKGIAAAHGKTVGQVILRWNVQRGVVVIPKSTHRERIEENFNIWDLQSFESV